MATTTPNRQPWTPEPYNADDEEYDNWGLRHFGEIWYTLRKDMLHGRDAQFQKSSDATYCRKQATLRSVEHAVENGNLAQPGKPWADLQAWARYHYGEAWYRGQEAVQLDRQWGNRAKANKRRRLLDEAEGELDRRLLSQGKTWAEMMQWQRRPDNTAHDTIPEIPSPAVSERSGTPSSGFSTFPPSEEEEETEEHQESRYGVLASQEPDDPWEQLEWSAVRGNRLEDVYEMQRARLTDLLRSSREDKIAEQIRRDKRNKPVTNPLDSSPAPITQPRDTVEADNANAEKDIDSIERNSAKKSKLPTLEESDRTSKAANRHTKARSKLPISSSTNTPAASKKDAQGKKRGRGRPRKIPSSSVFISSKKARGRPRKTIPELNISLPLKKPRGRPRKIPYTSVSVLSQENKTAEKTSKRKHPSDSGERLSKRQELDGGQRRSRRVRRLAPERGQL